MLTYITKHIPHTHFLLFFSFDFILSTIQERHTHTLHGVHVIYLEPIVNSSLWLNENVDKTLQSYANTGRSVKGEIHKICQVPAHYTWLLGRQQGDGKQGGSEGEVRML